VFDIPKEPPLGGATYYRWDEQHRLLSAEPVAGPVTLTYNARGLRVQKETQSDVQHFLYDFQKVLQEYDGLGDVQQEYTWTLREFGSLLSQYDGTDSSYYHYGEPGSTAALTNPAQTSTDEWIYRAFGEVESRRGSTETPFKSSRFSLSHIPARVAQRRALANPGRHVSLNGTGPCQSVTASSRGSSFERRARRE